MYYLRTHWNLNCVEWHSTLEHPEPFDRVCWMDGSFISKYVCAFIYSRDIS
jgi:hypothetical protein